MIVVDVLPTALLLTDTLHSTYALLSAPLPPRAFTPSSTVNTNLPSTIFAEPISLTDPSRAVAFNLIPSSPGGNCRPSPIAISKEAPGFTFLPV